MVKLTVPISNLFNQSGQAKKIIALCDCVEGRHERIDLLKGRQEIFHSEIQLTHILHKDDILALKKISGNKNLKLISFHVATNYSNPVLKNGQFYPGGREYSSAQLLANAQKNIRLIRSLFGKNILIAVENNNYYSTEAYRHVTEPGFLCELVHKNGIWFLYDIAHGRITAHNKKIGYAQYRAQLPLDRLAQIHLSRWGSKNKGLAFDSHSVPGRQEIRELTGLLHYPTLKYVTVEYYRDPQKLLKILRRIREVL